MFNDEFDMLEIHLAIMNPVVDRFIILEGNKTWSGRPKPWLLSENLDRIQQYRDKIEIIKLIIPQDYNNWQTENYSRASLQQGIDHLNDNDIVIHGDLDELPNTDKLNDIIGYMDLHDRPVSLSLDMYAYHFDQRMMRQWTGTVIARKRMFRDPQQLYKGENVKRKDRSHCVVYPQAAGWHWTWIGDDQRIRNKVVSCIESQHRDPEQVLDSFRKLDTASAINHKCVTETVTPNYPAEINQVLAKYPQYWTRPQHA